MKCAHHTRSLFLLLSLVMTDRLWADTPIHVTTLKEQKALRISSAVESWTFDIEARVGFASQQQLYLQQAGVPMSFRVPEEFGEVSSKLNRGALVRISGTAVAGESEGFREMVVLQPKGQLQAPKLLKLEERGKFRFANCYLTGRVVQVVRKPSRTFIRLKVDGVEVGVEVSQSAAREHCLSWIDRRVRVEGVLRLPHDQPILLLQSLEQLALVESQPESKNDTGVNSDVGTMRKLRDARVLFSGGHKIVVQHEDFDRPLVVWSCSEKPVGFQEVVALLCLAPVDTDEPSEVLAPSYLARYIEVNGKSDEVITTSVSSLSDIASPAQWRGGLVQLTGMLERISNRNMTIRTSGGRFRVLGADFSNWTRPAEGVRLRVAGIPFWSTPDHLGAEGPNPTEGAFPKLTLVIPSPSHCQLDSVPVRVSKAWLIGIATVVCCVLLGGVLWNRALQSQVAVRTRQLKEVNSHLTTSFEAVREAIVLSDQDGAVVRVNSKFEQFFGFRPEVGSSLEECLKQLAAAFESKRDFARFCEEASRRERHEEIELPMNGRSIQAFRNSIRDQQGRLLGSLWAFYDCTDQRRLEHDLLQAQKMEAIGQLSGGLAHDLNNLLAVISANIDVLALAAERAGVETQGLVSSVEIAVHRAANLTRQMLDFARSSQLNMTQVDINLLVQELYHLARGTMDAHIDLSLSMHPEPLIVKADASRIVQVLLNLCINARDAIGGDKGSIRIRTRLCETDPENRLACMEVEDDGVGMTEEVRQRMFDPFFTTKERHAGTGLGLSTAFGIVRQLGGHIDCDSAVSQGTVFRVFLPLLAARDLPAALKTPRPKRTNQTPGMRLLLVDDEALLREAGARVLEALAHSVTTATDGLDAIEIIERESEFDAVLLDLTMPRMDGHEACQIIRERWPSLPIIICSGYSTTQLDDSLPRVSFLAKPFRVHELMAVLSGVRAG